MRTLTMLIKSERKLFKFNQGIAGRNKTPDVLDYMVSKSQILRRKTKKRRVSRMIGEV